MNTITVAVDLAKSVFPLAVTDDKWRVIERTVLLAVNSRSGLSTVVSLGDHGSLGIEVDDALDIAEQAEI